MELVDEYSDRFKKLYKRVDPNNGTSVENTIRQFLSGLNLVIAPMVYVSGPANLDVVINTAKSIKAEYKITQRNI